MAKINFKGLEEYENQLLKLRDLSRETIGKAIYDGAGLIADAVKAEINNIPVDNRVARGDMVLYGISEPQKEGLIEGFGISKMQDDSGYLNVKLGFAGYNSVKTKSYPNGQPNSVVARSLNSGTSFRQRIPFVDNAVRANKEAAEEAMRKKFDEAIKDAIN